MRYFLIAESSKMIYKPYMLNWNEKFDIRDIHPETAYKLPARELVFFRSNEETIFTDIISNPIFLISEKIKNVVKMYEPCIAMKELVLLDKVYGKAERYFIPLFEEVDCLKEESIFNLNHSEVKKFELDTKKIRGRSIFRISGVEKQYIVGNLDIVESILKRGCLGIQLTELLSAETRI